MRIIIVEPCSKIIELGRYGENEATAVYLPLAEFQNYTPGGTFSVLVRRPDVTEPSSVNFTVEGGYAIWVVGEDQLAVEGYGEVELRYVIGETRALSRVWSTHIGKSLLPVGDTPPDPFESWYENILEAGDRAEGFSNAAKAYSEAAQTAEEEAAEAKRLSEEYADDALEHRNAAEGFKNAAENAASEAEKAENEAKAAAESAKADKSAAQAAAQAAEASRQAALASENAAKAAQAAANASATAAGGYASEAIDAANAAGGYAGTAQQYASAAREYAASAAGYASQAQSSAQAAAQSAQNAATSEHNASLSETNAAESERQAGLSKNAAAQSAQNAGQSEFAAQGYAEDAEAAATDIQDSIDGVAQEPTAQVISQKLDAILTAIEDSSGSAESLNGFGLELDDTDNSVDLTYSDVETGEEITRAKFPTDTTAVQIALALQALCTALEHTMED